MTRPQPTEQARQIILEWSKTHGAEPAARQAVPGATASVYNQGTISADARIVGARRVTPARKRRPSSGLCRYRQPEPRLRTPSSLLLLFQVEPREVEEDGGGEADRVDAVQHAAVADDQRAVVLDAAVALDGRHHHAAGKAHHAK